MKILNEDSTDSPGFGAGEGTIDTVIYECPCGKGTVEKIVDNIPGFKSKDVIVHCDDCRAKYSEEDIFDLIKNS